MDVKMGNKERFFGILLFEMLLVGVVWSQKNLINQTDGAYSNLLIAIQKEVPEDLTIIDNLKAMFTSASNRLYLASKQHVYWKHIKILVPNTWSLQSQYQFARTETFESANILVHDPPTDDDDNHEPRVDQLGGCGQQGIHMHLTPKYIQDETYREDKFGRTDIVLVRNWGYLRWGLFKEHYDGKGGGAPGYDSGGGIEGTRCSLKIKGNVLKPDGNSCGSAPNVGIDHSCRFVPETTGQSATASILFGTRDAHIHSVEGFCGDDTSDPKSLHNELAQNVMNIKCGGDSAWKVMEERTTDFQAGVQPGSDTTPTFHVIQLSSVRSVVLVLDISGSMSGSRFDRMIASTTDYILNVIPDDSKLGIVVFDTTSEIKATLTDITDTGSRQGLVNALPPATKGTTCIGCGILDGIQVLGSYAQGGYLLLLSDGGENASPYISDTYDEIQNSGVIIDTITISNSADQKMEDLSNITSGISTFCSDSGTGTCLIQAFQSTITERPDVGTESVPIQIYSSEVVIESNPGFKIVPVIIDDALGNDTVITVIWSTGSSISVVLTGPDGTQVDENDPRYHIDLNTKIVSINLPVAKPGLWNVNISSSYSGNEYASVAVTSKPSTEGYKPVTVSVILGSRDLDFSQTPALAIYAQVQRDYQPVLNADVTAIISDSYSSTTTMPLLDNGSGSDLFKDDGTYSGFFLNFTSNGRYNVKVNVQGYDDAIEVAEVRRRKRSAEPEVQDSASQPSFMRTASGGVFKVESFTLNAPDTLPPSRIQDLVYTSFNYDNSTVTLSWTAVGDDLDQGTAYSYELRYSTNSSEVRNNFNNSHRVTQDQLVVGNISEVSSAGVVESVTISLSEKGQDIVYYFAIRAWDEAGNGGDLSNIASLSIRFIPLAVTTTMDPTTIVTDVETDLISTISDQTQAFTDLTSRADLSSTTESVSSASPSKTATPISTTDASIGLTVGPTKPPALPPGGAVTTIGQSNPPVLTTAGTFTTAGQSNPPATTTDDDFTTGGQTVTASPVTTTEQAFTTASQSPNPVSTTEDVLTTVADPESTTNEVSMPLLTGSQKSSSSKPMMSSANIRPTIGNPEMTTNTDASRKLSTSGEPRTTSSSDELTTNKGHTTGSVHSKEPSEPEPAEPTEPDNQGLVIGLSCALGVVTVIAVVFIGYSFFLKQSITNVKRISPTPSAWAQHQELTVVEVVPHNPTFNNPTYSTA